MKFWLAVRRWLFFRLSFLEEELAKERAEKRELLDALLMAKGLPPLTKTEFKPLPRTAGRALPSQWRRNVERQFIPREKPNGGEPKPQS